MGDLDRIGVDVTGKVADLLKALAEAEVALDAFAKKTEQTSARTKKSTSEAGKDVEDFERLVTSKLKDGETAFTSLGRQIDDTRTKIGGLRSEFARTGSSSIFGDLKQSEADLKKLEGFVVSMRPQFQKVFASTGYQSGKSMMKSFEDALSQDGPEAAKTFGPMGGFGAPTLIAISSVLAPLIVAAFAAAVTTGIGVLGIGLGAYLVKSNSMFQANFQKTADDVTGILTKAADPMVNAFDNAFSQIDGFFQAESGQFAAFFQAAAGAVGPIVSILTNLVGQIMPSLIAMAGSFTAALNDPDTAVLWNAVGGALAELFQTVADNKELVEGFFGAVLVTVIALVAALDLATTAVGALAKMAKGTFDTTIGWAKQIGTEMGLIHAKVVPAQKDVYLGFVNLEALTIGTFKAISDVDKAAAQDAGYKALQKELTTTALNMDTLAGAASDKVFNALMTADMATLHWYESLTSLRGALKQNKDALDIHTKAGQADREAILGAVQANIQLYDTMIANGSSAADAAAAYDKGTAALYKQLEAAGLLPAQIDKIIGKYKQVPTKIDIAIAMDGLAAAINSLADLIAQINGLHSKSITLTIAQYNDVYGGGGDQGKGRSSPPTAPATHGDQGPGRPTGEAPAGRCRRRRSSAASSRRTRMPGSTRPAASAWSSSRRTRPGTRGSSRARGTATATSPPWPPWPAGTRCASHPCRPGTGRTPRRARSGSSRSSSSSGRCRWRPCTQR